MKTLSKVVTFQKQKGLCILNKNSGDDTLNSVLCLGMLKPDFLENWISVVENRF